MMYAYADCHDLWDDCAGFDEEENICRILKNTYCKRGREYSKECPFYKNDKLWEFTPDAESYNEIYQPTEGYRKKKKGFY